MLDKRLVNDIRNALQAKKNKISFRQFRSCQAWIGDGITVTIGNEDFWVVPIMSYETIVGFAEGFQIYEVGKYSRTTSKQFTQICNQVYDNLERIFVERIW